MACSGVCAPSSVAEFVGQLHRRLEAAFAQVLAHTAGCARPGRGRRRGRCSSFSPRKRSAARASTSRSPASSRACTCSASSRRLSSNCADVRRRRRRRRCWRVDRQAQRRPARPAAIEHRDLLVPERAQQEPQPRGDRAVAVVVGDDLVLRRDAPLAQLRGEIGGVRPGMPALRRACACRTGRDPGARNARPANVPCWIGSFAGARVGEREAAIDDRQVGAAQRDRQGFRLHQVFQPAIGLIRRVHRQVRVLAAVRRRLNRIDAVAPQIRCPGTPLSTNSSTARGRPPDRSANAAAGWPGPAGTPAALRTPRPLRPDRAWRRSPASIIATTGKTRNPVIVASGSRKPSGAICAGASADLLAGFADRGGDGIGVAGLDPAAGKTDLAGVVAQAHRCDGSAAPASPPARHQADQHRGFDAADASGSRPASSSWFQPATGGRRIAADAAQRAAAQAGRAWPKASSQPARGSRAGSTTSISRRRSSSPICDQRAISAVVRWQPSHKPSSPRLQMPMQGLSTARKRIHAQS